MSTNLPRAALKGAVGQSRRSREPASLVMLHRFSKRVVAATEATNRLAVRLRLFLRRERDADRATGSTLRPRMLLRGHMSCVTELYDGGERPDPTYLTEWERIRAKQINEVAPNVLSNKLLFERTFSSRLPVPRLLALVGNRRFESMMEGERHPMGTPIGLDELWRYAPCGLVAKLVDGRGGHLFRKLERTAAGVRFNGEEMSVADAESRLRAREPSIVTPFVQQSKVSESMNPASANTIRVMTFVDPETGAAFVGAAVQRIGQRDSGFVDNWTSKGVVAALDLRTGVVGDVVSRLEKGTIARTDRHPDSGTVISGLQIPHWDRIVETLLRVASAFPVLPYVGWDVIPTDDAFVVIEGNASPALNNVQVFGGLLADDRMRRFYLHHKVITRKRAEAAARAMERKRDSADQSDTASVRA